MTGSSETDRIAWRHRLAVLATVAAAATIEALTGRPAICRCTRIALWTRQGDGPETSQMVADWYSPSHLIHGLILYAVAWALARRRPVGVRLVAAVLVEACWELVENAPPVIARYRAATVAFGYSGDSILNSMCDIGFMVLGFMTARRLPIAGSVLLGLLLELAALAAIRDNLTLNIVMLLHPVAAIRTWQGG